jgi:hypothetical protein
MDIKLKSIALMAGAFLFLFILRFVKRNTFRPSSALLWCSVPVFFISIPIFAPFYKWLSVSLFSMDDARHIIYIFIIIFLLIYDFYLSVKISQLSDRVQELISFTAILEKKPKV